MGGARFVAEAETIDGHVLVAQGDYPALGRGEGRVRGELFLVSDALLAELDLFEDCPRLYRRAEITLSDGSRALAYWRPEDC